MKQYSISKGGKAGQKSNASLNSRPREARSFEKAKARPEPKNQVTGLYGAEAQSYYFYFSPTL